MRARAPSRSVRAVATMGRGVVRRRWRVRWSPMPREAGEVRIQGGGMVGGGRGRAERRVEGWASAVVYFRVVDGNDVRDLPDEIWRGRYLSGEVVWGFKLREGWPRRVRLGHARLLRIGDELRIEYIINQCNHRMNATVE